VDYLHKGISARAFTKSISIVDTVEVLGAEYVDGILRIRLENVIPESKKPRKIIIANGNLPLVEPTKTEKQLLVED
jgi:molecular chaperone IbpA